MPRIVPAIAAISTGLNLERLAGMEVDCHQ